jgi:hypothetical protein
MSLKNQNGSKPAYPSMDMNNHMGVDRLELRYEGLTKREAFAMAAMQAIIPSYMNKPVSLDDIDSPQRLCAQWSIKFADELLKQLEP